MSENIIPFKRVGPLKVEVHITRDGRSVDELTTLERTVVAYELADQIAIILRLGNNLDLGHKLAISAHQTALDQRAGAIPEEFEDPTDWTDVLG